MDRVEPRRNVRYKGIDARLERMTLATIFVIIFFSGCYGNDVYFEISFNTILSTNNVTTVGRVFGLTLVLVTYLLSGHYIVLHCTGHMVMAMLKILPPQLE